MSEPQPLHKTEFPGYGSDSASPEIPAFGSEEARRLLPEGELHTIARHIGSALGHATNTVRETTEPHLVEVRDRIKDMSQQLDDIRHTASKHMDDIRDVASQRIEAARIRAEEVAVRIRSKAQQMAEEYPARAQQKAAELRSSVRHLARTATNEYPLHVILAAGVVGILVGAGLRARRENRG